MSTEKLEYYISSTKFSLQERQTKKNGKVYDVCFRVISLTGEEIQKKLSGYKTKALAKEAHTEFITTKCELIKNNPLKKKNIKKEEPTVGELFKQYILTLGIQNKEATIYDKKSAFEWYILPQYENKKVSALTKEELYRWQDALWITKSAKTGEQLSYKTLSKVRAYFGAFLSWCESRYGYKNFLQEVDKPKRRTPKTEMLFWKKEEFEAFISKVDNQTYRAIFTVMFFTGRRKGEVLALSPQDIDLTNKKICFNKSVTRKTLDNSTYKVTSTKADKSQTLPVCDRVIKELSEYNGQAPFYFGGEKPVHDNSLSWAFQQGIKASGVKRIRLHDLRHSFVSMLIHLGANLMVVADLIGDTTEQVTKTYGHLYEEDKQAIINRLG